MVDHLVTPNTLVVDQWAYEWEREINSQNRFLGNIIRGEYLRYFAFPPDHHGNIIIMTHSFFYEFMKQWPGFSFVTMLRDPVRRVVSQFYFQRRTFSDFAESEIDSWLNTIAGFEFNLQTAALCGAPSMDIDHTHLQQAKKNLHLFDFVGFVEQYEKSLRLFDRVYQIKDPAAPPKVNANPEIIEIPPWMHAKISDRCQYDIQLYEYAQLLFMGKLIAFEMADSGDPSVPPSSIGSDT
jgi:hypothetical protein